MTKYENTQEFLDNLYSCVFERTRSHFADFGLAEREDFIGESSIHEISLKPSIGDYSVEVIRSLIENCANQENYSEKELDSLFSGFDSVMFTNEAGLSQKQGSLMISLVKKTLLEDMLENPVEIDFNKKSYCIEKTNEGLSVTNLGGRN
ncbi:MAG: hypothetical protein PVJ67_01835 [Candidatus Pacearchaeota archaeon]|jgi:hypothetical protein